MSGAVHHFDIRNEDRLTYDAQGIAALFSCPEAGVAFGRVPPGGMGMQGIAGEECEDNAVVLGGMLSYPTTPGREAFAAKGAWVVARPGEVGGYWNQGGRPVTIFVFRPRTPGRARGVGGSPRIFTPGETPAAPRVEAYATESSRGEVLTLHPGEQVACGPALVRAPLVTAGRVMALMGREKIALEAGEGLVLAGTPADIVGVGGLSSVVMFSTSR